MTTLDRRTVPLDWIKIENVLAEFESQRLEGPAAIKDFLPPNEDPYFLPLLRELIRVDLELSWNAGTPRSLDDYRREFPILLTSPESFSSIAFEEFRLRREIEPSVTRTEYAERYQLDVSDWPLPDVDLVRTHLLYHFSVLDERGDRVPDPSDYPEVGSIFLGFRILLELGSGAFARVYLAEQRDLACRQVVLKISTLLLEESQTLARLQHTNIVPIYSSHRVGRFQAICMPYFGSTTLNDLLIHFNRRDPASMSGNEIVSTIRLRRAESTLVPGLSDATKSALNPPTRTPTEPLLDYLEHLSLVDASCWIVSELAEGLAYAHGRGILHCDIKPANVLMSHEGRPMLFDFNLAANGQGEVSARGGTPYYMAPEQLRGLRGEPSVIDPRTDLYALGLIFHELLCGRLPNEKPHGPFEEQVRALLRGREIDPALETISNPALRAILQKCLAHEPARRYASAMQLHDDLIDHLNHRPLRWAKEPFGMNRARKWVRRNSWITSSVFLASLAVVGISLGLIAGVETRRERSRTDAELASRALSEESASLRTRLIAPDPDPVLLRLDLDRTEAILARWKLIETDREFREQVQSHLNDLDSARIRETISDAMLQTAQGRFLLGETTVGLNWNARAEAFAEDEERRWSARRQRIGFLQSLGRDDEAKALKESLEKVPEGANSRFLRVQTLLNRGDARGALKELQTRDLTLLKRPDYWHYKATCHAQLSEWKEAIAAYTTATTLQPFDNDHLYAFRARAYLALKEFAAAKSDLDSALKIKPLHARYLVDRALARNGTSDFAGAIADLAEAEKLWPEHTRIFFLRAQVRRRANDLAGAERDRQAGLARKPGDEVSWITRGVARLNSDPRGALEDFEAAIAINPASSQAIQNRAHVLSEKLNRPQEAIRSLDALIERQPDDRLALGGRGVLLARQGQREQAHRDARRLLASDPTPLQRYQAACIFALTAKTDPEDRVEAIRLLAKAFGDGLDSSVADGDPDLDPIRSDASFQSMLKAVRHLEQLQARAK